MTLLDCWRLSQPGGGGGGGGGGLYLHSPPAKHVGDSCMYNVEDRVYTELV